MCTVLWQHLSCTPVSFICNLHNFALSRMVGHVHGAMAALVKHTSLEYLYLLYSNWVSMHGICTVLWQHLANIQVMHTFIFLYVIFTPLYDAGWRGMCTVAQIVTQRQRLPTVLRTSLTVTNGSQSHVHYACAKSPQVQYRTYYSASR